MLKSSFTFLLFFALLISASPLSAQDDLYGDIRPKSKEPKKGKMQKGVEGPALTWNDSVSGNYSIIYFYRKFEGSNAPPIVLKINDKLIGDLNSDSQLNYKIFSEGEMWISATYNGLKEELPMEIKNGNKYFVTVNLTNRNIINKAEGQYAFNNFRPFNVERVSEINDSTATQKTVEKKDTITKPITPVEKTIEKKDTITKPITPVEKTPVANSPTIKGGTGFILSSQGYVITNFHIVDRFKHIYVRGINGDSTRRYKAKVILEDKINDLALLKISDSVSIGKLPYDFNPSVSDTGEIIHVLGYPVLSGSAKVAEGTITAQTGFEGTNAAFQISVPLPAPTSGGPVCDWKGDIIGISNVKGGENKGSYVIKIFVLKKFLSVMEKPITLSFPDDSSDKTFSERESLIKKYVLVIETE